MDSDFKVITPETQPDYRSLISPVTESVWPEFMFHDPVAWDHWDGLFDLFPGFQFAIVNRADGVIAGFANSVPLSWHSRMADLPDEGWDWALIKSARDQAQGLKPNTLCGLQIAIAPDFRGRNLASVMLGQMVKLARSNGFSSVIVPVRPSFKDRYPLSPIDAYIQWTNDDGLPYDPWLRVHVRCGGRIIKPCPLAMKIMGTISDWEEWTGLRFFESGRYVIPGALVPVDIDVQGGLGTYVEPNVWVVHDIKGD